MIGPTRTISCELCAVSCMGLFCVTMPACDMRKCVTMEHWGQDTWCHNRGSYYVSPEYKPAELPLDLHCSVFYVVLRRYIAPKGNGVMLLNRPGTCRWSVGSVTSRYCFGCLGKIAKSDYWLRHVCPYVRPHGTTRLPLDGYS